jgi:serine/threonine protein kinase/formylglycine-generating enzyme required for sulfatase activity
MKEEIGRGGVGTVMMAIDNDVGRPVAVKFIRDNVPAQYVERFRRESLITGRLEHPNIVPVYDVGAMEIGGEGKAAGGKNQLYMTMKLVRGRNLAQLLGNIRGGKLEDERAWPLRRLVEAFHDACNAVAFAHSRGVIHRDLKPSNIMVGEFGEVLVVDWGLAKIKGEDDPHEDSFLRGPTLLVECHTPIHTTDTPTLTMQGEIMGTPQYMPPEQAEGNSAEIDERSDVYALGGVLYEILTLHPPVEGKTMADILRKVLSGDIRRPSELVADDAALRNFRTVPPELEQICLRCLSRQKQFRYYSATELGQDISQFLAGAKDRERRHELAEQCAYGGRRFMTVYYDLKGRLEAAKDRAKQVSGGIKGYEPLEEKRPIWMVQDAVRSTEKTLVRLFNDAIAKFMEGMGFEACNPNILKGLSELYWDRFLEAEKRDDETDMAYYQGLTLTYGREWFEIRVKGEGTLAVTTQWYSCGCLMPFDKRGAASGPRSGMSVRFDVEKMVECSWGSRQMREEDKCLVPEITISGERRADGGNGQKWGHGAECEARPLDGVDVWIFKYEERDRLLVPSYPEELAKIRGVVRPERNGSRPQFPSLSPDADRGLHLGKTPLPRMPIPMGSYLLLLRKEGHVDVRCPVFIGREAGVTQVVTMYRPEEVPAGFLPVPDGAFIYGGEAAGGLERQTRSVQDFFIARHPVTCAEYLEFLNDIARTDLEQAASRAPRESGGLGFYWEPENGVFRLPAPGERQLKGGGKGQDWQSDWPVINVNWYDALAFCEWKSNREGRFFRLLTEDEWEKAARGVDGRAYPFGKYGDPAFLNIMGSLKEGNRLVGIGEFPLDESPYGVRGLGGNSRDWCFNEAGERYRQWRWRWLKGGSWAVTPANARTACRYGDEPGRVVWINGFRLCSPCVAFDLARRAR